MANLTVGSTVYFWRGPSYCGTEFPLEEVTIDGETSRSWIVIRRWDEFKFPKGAPKDGMAKETNEVRKDRYYVFESVEDYRTYRRKQAQDRIVSDWILKNRDSLRWKIESIADVDLLRKISEMVGLELPPVDTAPEHPMPGVKRRVNAA
jgi:hypothetical protein